METPYVCTSEKKEFEVRMLNEETEGGLKKFSANWGTLLIEPDGKVIHIDADAIAILDIPFSTNLPLNFFDIISTPSKLKMYMTKGEFVLSSLGEKY